MWVSSPRMREAGRSIASIPCIHHSASHTYKFTFPDNPLQPIPIFTTQTYSPVLLKALHRTWRNWIEATRIDVCCKSESWLKACLEAMLVVTVITWSPDKPAKVQGQMCIPPKELQSPWPRPYSFILIYSLRVNVASHHTMKVFVYASNPRQSRPLPEEITHHLLRLQSLYLSIFLCLWTPLLSTLSV